MKRSPPLNVHSFDETGNLRSPAALKAELLRAAENFLEKWSMGGVYIENNKYLGRAANPPFKDDFKKKIVGSWDDVKRFVDSVETIAKVDQQLAKRDVETIRVHYYGKGRLNGKRCESFICIELRDDGNSVFKGSVRIGSSYEEIVYALVQLLQD